MIRRMLLPLLALGMLLAGLARGARAADPPARPNILWISAEDMSPDLGCYGDTYAVTPNLDRLAAQGVRCTNAFSNAPVCAPARSAIITGMYATTIGTQNMRCQGVPPPTAVCFPEYLRAAGYYCTNNPKTDYQFAAPPTAWDESGPKAHWQGRAAGQPFFAVVNLEITHESQIRSEAPALTEKLGALGPGERHDPAKAALPPYYPDTPAVRRDWARYYDLITLMDRQAGDLLGQLEKDGLADDTIVFFWSDHGRGLPRAKRWVYDSGTHVPLLVRVPERYRALASPENPDALKPGSTNPDLLMLFDLAPTVLSLAGVKPPPAMQAHAFLGAHRPAPRQYVYAHRDRMDETYDLTRSVRDKRYLYIRNYMPYLSHAQEIAYMEEMPTMREWRRLQRDGGLDEVQRQFFRPTKPIEELYDCAADPHNIRNLVDDPQYQTPLVRLRREHLRWMTETGDVGLIPEPELNERQHPDGEWETTVAPSFAAVGDAVRIACPTPGASIGYRLGDGPRKLYSEPVTVPAGTTLYAQAYRLGFKASAEEQYHPGDPPLAAVPPDAASGGNWRARLDATDLLQRPAAVKAVDGRGERAVATYLKALDDSDASVRYWAVVGLHFMGSGPAPEVKAAVLRRLSDRSPVVRVAAAHADADWGEPDRALPLLTAELRSPSDSVRLNAVTALNALGERARPAIAWLTAARKDPAANVQHVAEAALRRLGALPAQ